jgi:hypothetical protein
MGMDQQVHDHQWPSDLVRQLLTQGMDDHQWPMGMDHQVHDHQWPSDLVLAELMLGHSNSTMIVALGEVLLLEEMLLWPVALLLWPVPSLRRDQLMVSLVLWLLLEVARQCLLEDVRVEVAGQCVLEEVR